VQNVSLCYLQDGIQPMWEDPVNKGGGRWVLNLDKRQRMRELNDLWLETVIKFVVLSVPCSSNGW